MKPRINNPAMVIPGAMQALLGLNSVLENGSVPAGTLALAHLRASQINGCSVCVDMGWRMLKHSGETEERLFAVSAWHDAPYFTDAERAALALTDAVTRVSDQAVADDVWDEAARHYDERALAELLLAISVTNVWNRLNIATKQVAGEWMKSADAKSWSASHAG